MAGVDLDPVRQRAQPLVQRVEQPLGALLAVHGKVGPGDVPHEQRVAREQEPGLLRARVVDDGHAAVLRPVPRRVQDLQGDLADLEDVAVGHRPGVIGHVRQGMGGDPGSVAQGERPVPRDVVGVGMRLDHADQRGAVPAAGLEHLRDVERRIDDHGLAGLLAPHHVARAAEVPQDDLLEDHAGAAAREARSERAMISRWISFVPSPISRILASR